MTDPERERFEALKRYAAEVDREMDRLQKRCEAKDARRAVVEARERMLKRYCENQNLSKEPEGLLLLPLQYLKNDHASEKATFEHLRGLRKELSISLRNLAVLDKGGKESADTSAPAEYEEADLSENVLEELALLAVEKWSPGQDIEEVADEVKAAFFAARQWLGPQREDSSTQRATLEKSRPAWGDAT